MTEQKPIRSFRVGSGNFVSQIFFLWVFWFILLLRRTKDLKDLTLNLRNTETASFNDKILDEKWKEEINLAAKQNRFINNNKQF
jgi:hypothetical protein